MKNEDLGWVDIRFAEKIYFYPAMFLRFLFISYSLKIGDKILGVCQK